MKLTSYTEPVLVTINGTEVKVPKGILFLTINQYNHLQGWITRPSIDEGFWSSSTQPISLGFVELEEDDKRWDIFDVKRNDWYESYYYD
ncbi:hypothetical protein FDG95_gp563 [Pectobacterium phage vB_PcaM_CBB]|uniref:Uncharacterized protein n=1 Tax=Pectobacterium phage vB_PcaM_CBB TaxID=2772511 RepID=A0A1L2CVE8_9CAUD|nr:hypothetical protein FDG95_gp563 [Pectobacterium phage vB_PcaM_CBB]AMM43979.1 hypothetical protein CBB_416 [Pectobacterium phage vB_PcaM_CBB]